MAVAAAGLFWIDVGVWKWVALALAVLFLWGIAVNFVMLADVAA